MAGDTYPNAVPAHGRGDAQVRACSALFGSPFSASHTASSVFLVMQNPVEVGSLSGEAVLPYPFHYGRAFSSSTFRYPHHGHRSLRSGFSSAERDTGLPCFLSRAMEWGRFRLFARRGTSAHTAFAKRAFAKRSRAPPQRATHPAPARRRPRGQTRRDCLTRGHREGDRDMIRDYLARMRAGATAPPSVGVSELIWSWIGPSLESARAATFRRGFSSRTTLRC